jgi:hypothetical protein
MRRAVALAVATLVIAGAASSQDFAQASSTVLTLQRVSVELPSLGTATLILHSGTPPLSLKGPYPNQKLLVGNLEIPVFVPAKLAPAPGETAIALSLRLRQVPEMVLALPLEAIPVRWEGYSEDGHEKVVMEGRISTFDRNTLDFPIRTIYENYSKISDVKVTTDGGKVVVRVLVSLYNPLGFDLIASSLDYKVRAGDRDVVAGQRRGFRLRGERWSDVLIEQEVAPGDAAAAGLAALLNPSSVRIEGRMSVRTPVGDRELQVNLGGS